MKCTHLKCPMRSTKYIHVSNLNPSYIQTITITLESSLMILLRKSLLPLLSEAMTILIFFQLVLCVIELYIKGIIQYTCFRVRLLSFSIFLRFIHFVVCIRNSFKKVLLIFHCMDISQFLKNPLSNRCSLGLFLVSDYYG